jgi:hypothetical protein
LQQTPFGGNLSESRPKFVVSEMEKPSKKLSARLFYSSRQAFNPRLGESSTDCSVSPPPPSKTVAADVYSEHNRAVAQIAQAAAADPGPLWAVCF